MNGNDVIAHNLRQQSPKSVIKVAILGAESTGKSTLCRDLATHFHSPWAGEYMREYLQNKWNVEHKTCTWEDLLPIAEGQIALENKQTQAAIELGNKYVFCDTSLFELMVYAQWYYDDCPAALTTAALEHHYDLTLLTAVDIPWVADDLRDSPHEREAISEFFETMLNRHHIPFKKVGGSRLKRVKVVDKILNDM